MNQSTDTETGITVAVDQEMRITTDANFTKWKIFIHH